MPVISNKAPLTERMKTTDRLKNALEIQERSIYMKYQGRIKKYNIDPPTISNNLQSISPMMSS